MYARAGIREYWIVDLNDDRVEVVPRSSAVPIPFGDTARAR